MIKRQSNQDGAETFHVPPPITFGCSLKFLETKVVLMHGMLIDGKGVAHAPNPKYAIELVQVEENGVVLDVPGKLCAQGEKVNLGIVCQIGTETLSGEFSAKIKKLHVEAKSDRESVEIDFLKFDQELWEKICNALKKRQSSVTRVIDAIRE